MPTAAHTACEARWVMRSMCNACITYEECERDWSFVHASH